MTQALANFSIESDSTILLSFIDGTNCRVKNGELSDYLRGQDLEKVQRALRLRKHFIEKVLPPGAAVLLLFGTIALASYDVQQISRRLQQQPGPSAYVAPDAVQQPATLTQLTVEAEATPDVPHAQLAPQTLLPELAPAPAAAPEAPRLPSSKPAALQTDSKQTSAKDKKPSSKNSKKSDSKKYDHRD